MRKISNMEIYFLTRILTQWNIHSNAEIIIYADDNLYTSNWQANEEQRSTYLSSIFSFMGLLSGLPSMGATIVLLLEVVPVIINKTVIYEFKT